ncbi:hypothetical protein [Micromonospora sp. WMMD737]|uniref:hypothetical protein n=1 Tax=Micromonospora sp. WMMD737 TaxID=3404113 RepID=UPI003B940482
MSFGENDRDMRLRRLRDAVIQAVTCGVDPVDLGNAFDEGLAEGRRINALRAGTVPSPRNAEDATRPAVKPEPGSALAALLNATASY